jgi:DNA-binding beta-propeller fold protein YncE
MRNGPAFCLMFLLLPGVAFGQASTALQLTARIALPNVDGRMDHMGVDLAGQRLFAAAFDNHTLQVIDLKAGRQVSTIPNLDEPQASYYDPSTKRLFVSAGGDGSVKIFDGGTFRLLQTVKLSADSDNVRYDARGKHVIVGYGGEKSLYGQATRQQGDGALAILETAGKKVAEIPTDAHPESFQLEQTGTRVFINVPDKKEIQVADLASGKTIAHWPLATCTDNFPMALDEAHHRLMVACRGPSNLLVLDTETGKPVASLPLDSGLFSDDLFYDQSKSRVYVVGRTTGRDPRALAPGLVEIFQQKDPDHYEKVGTQPTGWGAQTGFFVPAWGKLFVATRRQQDGPGGEILAYETK